MVNFDEKYILTKLHISTKIINQLLKLDLICVAKNDQSVHLGVECIYMYQYSKILLMMWMMKSVQPPSFNPSAVTGDSLVVRYQACPTHSYLCPVYLCILTGFTQSFVISAISVISL